MKKVIKHEYIMTKEEFVDHWQMYASGRYLWNDDCLEWIDKDKYEYSHVDELCDRLECMLEPPFFNVGNSDIYEYTDIDNKRIVVIAVDCGND